MPVLIALLMLGALGRPAAAEEIIYAVPNGDWRLVLQLFEPRAVRGPDDEPIAAPAVALRDALAMARPGVTIQLLPGVYKQDTPDDGIMFPRDGSPDRPITLRGLGSDTVIDGTATSGFSMFGFELVRSADEAGTLLRPDFRRGSICFRFDRKQWVVLDGLTLRNCADAAVIVRDSQYITLRNSIIMAGLYGLFAEGPATHHLLLENNVWIQDASQEMWSSRHWCEYKYGRLKAQAGALLAALDIAGGVIIRRNTVRNAFNGVRTDVSKAMRGDPSWRGRLSTNIEVYDNDFAFIRDNVLEPEYDATNWWFHGNRIRNAHAWFSFDGLYGGRWYVYDNVGWFDDKPSRGCTASGECKQWQERDPELCGDLHDAGRVFKFRPDGRYAPGPLYVFNNSWYLRTSVIKDGRIGYLGHWNNAIDFCRTADYPDGLCGDVKPFFSGFKWDVDNYSFGPDLSNHPDFPTALRAQGYRVNGPAVPHDQRLFVDAAHGDFTLVPSSPGRGAGCLVVEDETGVLACRDTSPERTGPDIGAAADLRHAAPVDFLHYDRAPYREAPRIVRVDLPEAAAPPVLRVVFSTVIAATASGARAELAYGSGTPAVLSEPCRSTGRELTCEIVGALPAGTPSAVRLPDAIVGENGEPATLWGSVSDVVAFRR